MGDDGAKKLYNAYINNNYLHNNYSANNYMTRGWFDFGKCVLITIIVQKCLNNFTA
ncbi:hypothetical protein [Clostridium tarantellae]|uniref:hypothetical protein n=1 Tax=Clostridium tarantellae TaxID=39493 RepID=UPI00147932F1|nr:hypothetical protein [Clostridium tarantellae]